ncbi:hypothetical protein GTQ34_08720 [Muricauda sp. JGD-17]|uniref:Uncharacterized protein n=1 Tax=Flagellimonas ochracea TaxID=2696472 RepID=A0A964TBV9_9FLAO|nr:hypothetical protein [Allomuricauda ochracea]NAY92000.1 hypothetical protein [Allomuricauda ochracea]
MKRRILPLSIFMLLVIFNVSSQQQQIMTVEHFSESRGDAHETLLLEIPNSQVVIMNNSLNSKSGFGMTLNLYGSVVVVDQMETMPDGTTQVVLRREDGKDFYGYKPTIRAILSKNLQ